MENLAWLFTGGFAKGYRTYILMTVAVVGIGANWALGDADTATTITALAAALGLGTAAHH
jgi:hypothetical protein